MLKECTNVAWTTGTKGLKAETSKEIISNVRPEFLSSPYVLTACE